MNYEFLTLADKNPAGGMNMILLVVVYAVIFGAMDFIFIRPNRKKQKEEQKMRENLQIGDEIVTIGGIYGTVCEVKDAYVLIEVDKDVKIRVSKQALVKDFTDPARQ